MPPAVGPPPGMVMNASASSNIIALRSCIDCTTRISPTLVPLICSGGDGCGTVRVMCGGWRFHGLSSRHSSSSSPCPPSIQSTSTPCQPNECPPTSRGASASGITPMTASPPSREPTASATAPIRPTLPPWMGARAGQCDCNLGKLASITR
jgi:hypothetical protein